MLRTPAIVAVGLALAAPTAQASTEWLPSVPLSTPAPDASEGADVAGDDAGDALAVWVREGIVQSSYHASGKGWTPAVDLSTAGRTASAPQVAMTPSGEALVVWVESSPSGTIIRSRTRPASSDFSAPSPLSEPGAAAPVLAMNQSGAAVVTWQQTSGAATVIEAAQRDDATQRFGLPAQLSGGSGTTQHVALDPAGDAVAIWTQPGTTRAIQAAQRPAGGSWSAPQTLATGTVDFPDVTLTPDGSAYARWRGPQQRGFDATRPMTSSFGAATWTPAADANAYVWNTLRLYTDRAGAPVAIFESGGIVDSVLTGEPLPSGPQTPLSSFYFSSYSSVFGAAWSAAGTGLVYWTMGGWEARIRAPDGTFGPIIPGSPSGVGVPGRMGAALDDQGNAIAVWEQQDASGYTIRTSALDVAPPLLTATSIPASVPVATEIPLAVTAVDRWSPDVKVTWRFSDGDNGVGPEITHTFATPGTTSVTITATDASGHTSTLQRAIEVLAPPLQPVAAPPDSDGDGVQDALDCAPTNPAVRPGAPEIPGNAIDENCDGRADPYPTVPATAQLTTVLSGKATRLLTLTVRQAQPGDTIRIACSGKGCGKHAAHTVHVGRVTARLDLSQDVHGLRLASGTRLQVRIEHAQRVTRIYTFVMHPVGSGAPRLSRRCQAPGEKATTTC